MGPEYPFQPCCVHDAFPAIQQPLKLGRCGSERRRLARFPPTDEQCARQDDQEKDGHHNRARLDQLRLTLLDGDSHERPADDECINDVCLRAMIAVVSPAATTSMIVVHTAPLMPKPSQPRS